MSATDAYGPEAEAALADAYATATDAYATAYYEARAVTDAVAAYNVALAGARAARAADRDAVDTADAKIVRSTW